MESFNIVEYKYQCFNEIEGYYFEVDINFGNIYIIQCLEILISYCKCMEVEYFL